MKIVIALACLVAFAAAVEETAGQIDADQDVAEQRYGGHGGGHRGGHHGGRGGGGGHHGGRYGRSLEEAQPFIVAEFQPEYVDYVSDDLQLAENRNYGGNRGHGSGGHRGRRSIEDENAVAIEDLEAAEHHSGGYRGHSSGGSGYGQSGSYGNRGSSGGSGYGGQHRGGRSVQEIAGAIEDLEVAEHHSKGYNRGGSSGGSSYRNHGSSSGYDSRPSGGGHGSHSGHGGRRY
ncbi:glycine-rich cell wall structural protein 1.8-like [Daphnia pulex]|uniref:glycine-rich cell wall structural protein 1.8-like n=1 Tax=Daphnia pulex TaxID=6669 RepID=UPI001EDFBCD3|nr:glycine-rich cell wall structural protein 1.8-like [Daphnia pulex]